MKLYYTTPSGYLSTQTKPNLSLGGYQSNTPVQSSVLGNMFGDISMYTVKNGNQNQYIGLMLKNELTTAATNVLVYFIYPSGVYSNIKIAAVTPTIDSDSHAYIEHINTIQSKPLYATFYDANGQTNHVDIGTIAAGASVGIWLERSLLLSVITAAQNDIYEVDPTNEYRYISKTQLKEDDIQFTLSWT